MSASSVAPEASMPYTLPTEEQRLAVESFRKFLEAEIKPVAREFRDRFVPKEVMRDLTMKIAPYGLPGAAVAEEFGGMGLSHITQAMLFEELATVSCDIALCVMINLYGAEYMSRAPAHLRERYLPGLLEGSKFIRFGVSEPDVGSDVAGLKMRAERDGDHFVINGEKVWISNGHYSDFFVVIARTGPKELSNILIDRLEHGYESRNIDKIGMNSQSTAQMFVTNARVPATNLIGELGGS